MIASSFFDPVLGLDVHFEMVPMPAPVPTPIPNPFTGIVFDPIGLAAGLILGNAIGMVLGASFKGPVLYYGAVPATNTGTNCKHVPGHILIPPGVAWAPFPKTPKPKIRPGEVPKPGLPVMPENDAICVFGSKTVTVMGSNAVRLGDIALSCSEPVRLPSSVVLAVPKGAPILIGGPPSLDLLAALMASLRTRFVSDSLHALVSRLNPGRLRNLLHKGVCFLTGHPVDVASGRVFTSAVDADLPGPIPLKVERAYNSGFAERDSPLGHGWSWTLDQAVWRERGRLVLLSDDGREIELDTFDLPGHRLEPGQELVHPSEGLTFRCHRKERFEVIDRKGQVREFAPVPGRSDGRSLIQAIRSACGNHSITFYYNPSGLLEAVADSCGRRLELQYNEAGRVRALLLPLPDGEGTTQHRRYLYDEAGDLIEVSDALDNRWQFRYVTHLLTQETDRTGLSFFFTYDGFGQDAWCVRTWGDGGIHDQRLAYDKRNHVTYVTDALGRLTRYHMNPVGLVTKVVDPLGGETRYEYDPLTLKRTLQADPLGHETRMTRDDRGNLTRLERPDGGVATLEYDEGNRPLSVTDVNGGLWTWRYDERGQLLERTSPSGEGIRYGWEAGLLRIIVLPGGRLTRLSYAADRILTKIELPGGEQIRFVSDRLGRVTEEGLGGGVVRRLHYDPEGRVRRVEEPGGLIKELFYDGEGNLVGVREGERQVRLRYKGRWWLAERKEAGQVLRFEYDLEGDLVAVVNELGQRHRWDLDAAGRVEREVGFDGTERRYRRDPAGRVTQVDRPGGRFTRAEHDPLGRLLALQFSDGGFCRYAYRPDGAMTRAATEEGEVVLDRDPVGRVLAEQVGETWVVSHFDSAGRRVRLQTTLGAAQSVEFDESGAAIRLFQRPGPEQDDVLVSLERDPLGQELARHLPGGLRVEWSHDPAGRPILRRTLRDGQELHRRELVRSGERISAIQDSATGLVRYTHDARGGLIAEERIRPGQPIPDPPVLRVMDAAGNIYRDRRGEDRRYGPGGRLDQAEGVSCLRDEEGNLLERRPEVGPGWRFHWDHRGMLREVERPDGLRVQLTYDAFARRTRKVVLGPAGPDEEAPREETRYIWDGPCLLHELSSLRDRTDWYWEPGTLRPLLRVRGDRCFCVVTDHLGAPTELYDEQGELVWRLSLDLYGRETLHAGLAGRCPFRWPGQYQDPELPERYNRFRYYSPDDGAYISPDPLGLNPSPRPFAYPADPLLLLDPAGLTACNTEAPSRKDALEMAMERAGLPKGAKPDAVWEVGDDVLRRGQPGYLYTADKGAHGRYMQFETENGSRVIAEHLNDGRPHFHAGQPKGDPTQTGVDFGWGGKASTAERYGQIGDKHHIYYPADG